MAQVFRRVSDEVQSQAVTPSEPELPELDRRARIVLGLFTRQKTITTNEAALALGLLLRTTRDLLVAWVKDAWLEIANPSRKSRRYRLSAVYRRNNSKN